MKRVLDDICFKIKKFREKVGYTQQQVSDSLSIDRSTYAYYESGKTIPDLNTLSKLAEIFKVPIATLLEKEKNDLVFSDVKSSYWGISKSEKNTNNFKKEIKNGNTSNNIFNTHNLEKTELCKGKTFNLGKTYKYPSFISDLSEREKKMILYFRLLSIESQDKISEIIVEKFKNSKIFKKDISNNIGNKKYNH